ncbi:MAG: TA system VapC family ribonuclease toxin [Actinomycetota bacterium]
MDTNVLVHAANESSSEHRVCREKLESLRKQAMPAYLTWSIVYEFIRVVTHRRVLASPWTTPSAWMFVSSLLDSPAFHVLTETEGHGVALSEVINEVPGLKGNVLHDTHVATIMREHGIHRIMTFDADFHRFKFLEVVDPTSSSG